MAFAPQAWAQEPNPMAGVTAFVDADANGDGALSQPEFVAFMQQMADEGDPAARFVRGFGAYGIAFWRVDSNRDGVASPSELMAARGTAPTR